LKKSAINALAILTLSLIVSSVNGEELQCEPMNSSRVDPNQNFTHEIQKLSLDISDKKITVTPVDFRGKTIPVEYSILDSDEWIVTALGQTPLGVSTLSYNKKSSLLFLSNNYPQLQVIEAETYICR